MYKIKNGIVIFDDYFNFPLNTHHKLLIGKMQKVIFKMRFNQKVDDLPVETKSISFGICFNQEIDNLPLGLENLSLGFFFFRKIDYLPPYLKKLSICGIFNYPIDNLPPSIEILILGYNFNQKIDCLPENLKILIIGFSEEESKKSDVILNNGMKLLKHHPICFEQPLNNLPIGLETLVIFKEYKFLTKLKKMIFYYLILM